MLPAANRLRHSGEFANAVRSGRRVGRGAVVVHLTVQQGTDNRSTEHNSVEQPGNSEFPGFRSSAPKAGFVVSKAVGGAVVRNKVKRRLRHLVGQRLSAYPNGTTLIVRALPGAADKDFRELGADLDAALAAAARPRRQP
jgi:ribonuclease P protein component